MRRKQALQVGTVAILAAALVGASARWSESLSPGEPSPDPLAR